MATYIPFISKKKNPTKKSNSDKDSFNKLHAKVRRILDRLEPYETEVKFHHSRKWRLDYAWPNHKVGLEVHGGIYINGRHTRGSGFSADREKMNEAQLLGWIIIEVTTDNLNQIEGWVSRAILLNSKS